MLRQAVNLAPLDPPPAQQSMQPAEDGSDFVSDDNNTTAAAPLQVGGINTEPWVP